MPTSKLSRARPSSLIARALILGALTIGLSAGAALAQERGEDRHHAREARPHPMMHMLDTDRDGKIAQSEIADEYGRMVAAMDVDKDGKLSADEFQRRGRWLLHLRAYSFFDLFDSNGDQMVTAEELNAPSARWFKRYDKNGDGVLAADELPNRGHHRFRHHR